MCINLERLPQPWRPVTTKPMDRTGDEAQMPTPLIATQNPSAFFASARRRFHPLEPIGMPSHPAVGCSHAFTGHCPTTALIEEASNVPQSCHANLATIHPFTRRRPIGPLDTLFEFRASENHLPQALDLNKLFVSDGCSEAPFTLLASPTLSFPARPRSPAHPAQTHANPTTRARSPAVPSDP